MPANDVDLAKSVAMSWNRRARTASAQACNVTPSILDNLMLLYSVGKREVDVYHRCRLRSHKALAVLLVMSS